ncbi:hypothetical protein Tco_0769642 [Tanacetum coccineum]|uniref:Uncharacterized protein n=1 Tax=Tanacetum coccineum TaxID=301880 RepID=A0ABQ4ZB80_9ASTR
MTSTADMKTEKYVQSDMSKAIYYGAFLTYCFFLAYLAAREVLWMQTLRWRFADPSDGEDTGCVSQPDWPAVIVINHYQAPQITAGQSGCDTQPDVPTLTCAPGAHCREIPSLNSLKSGQHGQILNETSNKAKIKKEIDAYEIINIKLEHSVAKLLIENENLNKENETLKNHYKDLYDSIKITRSKTIEQTTSLLANNADLKAQIQEKVFAIAALKNDLRKLKGNSVDTKFAKTSVLGKLVLQSLRNQSVVRQPNAFKSERPQMSKPRFASQVDVYNNLSKPVTQHYFPKRRESVFSKPDHMIASRESRNSSKNMPRFSSNDMVHNHYLDEAKKKTQERDRNSKTSVMSSARFQSIVDGSKPKPRRNNQTPRSLHVSKSSCVTITAVPKANHSKSSSSFSDSNNFVCSTCHKCVFNENHDACITKLLKEVNPRAKVPSNKTTNRNKPVEQTSFAKKLERHIPKGHRFSIKKNSVVLEKTMSPRSCLRWKPTCKIFKSVGLRWVPTGKLFRLLHKQG